MADEFENAPWFRFNGYQSGHWREESARWIREVPPSVEWERTPHFPHVNLEFCCEAHEDFINHCPFDAADVTRAAWLSVLASPPAGLTYGAHGIWSWESEPAHHMNHPNAGLAPTWTDASNLSGSTCMKHLEGILQRIPWWRLIPWPRMGTTARTDAGDIALVYLIDGVPLRIDGMGAQYFDPATGQRRLTGPATACFRSPGTNND